MNLCDDTIVGNRDGETWNDLAHAARCAADDARYAAPALSRAIGAAIRARDRDAVIRVGREIIASCGRYVSAYSGVRMLDAAIGGAS